MQRSCRIKNNATAFYLAELSKIRPSRHPEPCLFIRLTKDPRSAAPEHSPSSKSADNGLRAPFMTIITFRFLLFYRQKYIYKKIHSI